VEVTVANVRAPGAAYGVHVAFAHIAPASVQFWQELPPVPHAALSLPTRQMSFWQHPWQSVGPHWLSARHAPLTQYSPGAHCTHALPFVPQEVVAFPVVPTPRTQHPWQF
jgi:hypothetical protein